MLFGFSLVLRMTLFVFVLLFFAIASLSCIDAKTTTRHDATMTTNTLVNVVCNADLRPTCDLFLENAICQLHFNSTDKAQLRATCESLGCSASVCRDGLEAEDSRIGALSTVAKVFFGLGIALFYTVDFLIGYALMNAGGTRVFDDAAPRLSLRALQAEARFDFRVVVVDNDRLKHVGLYDSFVRLLKMRTAELGGTRFQLLFVAARQVENVCLIVGIAMTIAGIPIIINSESHERVSPPLVAFTIVSWFCHVALWTVCVAWYVQARRRTHALCSMFAEFADRLAQSSGDGVLFCVARTDIAQITECQFDHVAKLVSYSIAVVCVVASPAVSDDAIQRALMTTRPSAVGFANDHPEFVDF